MQVISQYKFTQKEIKNKKTKAQTPIELLKVHKIGFKQNETNIFSDRKIYYKMSILRKMIDKYSNIPIRIPNGFILKWIMELSRVKKL